MSAGRPQNILRPVKLTTYLPEDIRAQLDIHLFSTVEGRVPHGAYSKFLAERVREFFEPRSDSQKWGIEEALKTLESVTKDSDAAKGAIAFLRSQLKV